MAKSSRIRYLLLLCLTALTLAGPVARAEDAAAPILGFLKKGDTIVFVGDHATENGEFIPIIQTYLAVHFPEYGIRVVIAGDDRETISGLSESHIDKPRPVLFDRFEKDVAFYKPALVVACYGMHDGIYAPSDEKRFTAFKEGFAKLTKLVTEDLHAHLLVLTPPLWGGNYGNPNKDMRADSEFSQSAPFAGYGETVNKIAHWEAQQKHPNLAILDLNDRMQLHTAERRRADRDFKLQWNDYTPNATGYLLMAATVIQGLGGSPLVADLQVDAAKPSANSPDVTNLKAEAGGLAFTWKSPIPLPIKKSWDPKSVYLEQFDTTLNLYRLTVSGLKPGAYALSADGAQLAIIDERDLARGVNLAYFPGFKPNVQAQELLRLYEWGHPIFKVPPHADSLRPVEKEEYFKKIKELPSPVTMQISLVPAKGGK